MAAYAEVRDALAGVISPTRLPAAIAQAMATVPPATPRPSLPPSSPQPPSGPGRPAQPANPAPQRGLPGESFWSIP